MSELETKVQYVEKALRAVYRNKEPAAESLRESCIADTMRRIRALAPAMHMRSNARGEAQFLWRFLSAGAVAATVLVGVALTSFPQEPAALNAPADDMVATVLNPTMPF